MTTRFTHISDMTMSPGTVSKILWHFTGGPRWNQTSNSQDESPKPTVDAYTAFKGILASKELRIGGYREVVKVHVPRTGGHNGAEVQCEEAPACQELKSSPVCCLADIPIAHLKYHETRYGRFAIGFRRDSAIRAGFNPVFYTLHDTEVANAIYSGLVSLQERDTSYIRGQVSKVRKAIEAVEEYIADEASLDVNSELDNIEQEAHDLEEKTKSALREVETFLAYVKTFDRHEFQTIYCEREWRSVTPFKFQIDDIAMLVVPREGQASVDFFSDFVRNEVEKLGLPRHIPIVPWEDLVEH